MPTDSASGEPLVSRAPAVPAQMSAAPMSPRAALAAGASVLAVAAGFLVFAVAGPRAGAQNPGGDGAKARVALSANSRVVSWVGKRCVLLFIFPFCWDVTLHARKTIHRVAVDVTIPPGLSGVSAYADGTPLSVRLTAGPYSGIHAPENFPERSFGRESVRFIDRYRHQTLALRWDGDPKRIRARWRYQDSDRADFPDSAVVDVVLGGYARTFDIDLRKRGGRAAGSSALTLLAPELGDEAGE